MTEREGVIKFALDYVASAATPFAAFQVLEAWRSIYKETGLIGEDPARYDGYGFGNLSARTRAGLVITGTQTGAIERLGKAHYAEVTGWCLAQNRVSAMGPIKPSSESLTHAAVYEAFDEIQFVFHVHSPDIWHATERLSIACTPADIAYGTVEMALSLKKITEGLGVKGLMTMLGHEDGVMSWGTTARDAGELIISALAEARAGGSLSR